MEDDPLFLYLVVNLSLGMEAGKFGAQVGHALQYFMERFWPEPNKTLSDEEAADHLRFHTWRTSYDHAKISLGASLEEFLRIQEEYPSCIKVIDHGHTEVPPGSRTLVAIGPLRKSERSTTLRKLKPLKGKLAV